MLEICGTCRKPIKPGETTISVVRNLKKIYYHARCFGAKHLEEQTQQSPQDQKTNAQVSQV